MGQNCVGGIAGQAVSADVFNIGVYGEVSGTSEVGGAVGCNIGLIMNVHSHVNIVGNPTMAGGLVGYDDTPVFNSYSTGFVPDGGSNGGLVGFITDTTTTNSFWDTETSNQLASASGTGLTTAQLKNTDILGSLNDSSNFWNINPVLNNGYPYLVSLTPVVPDTNVVSIRTTPTNQRGLTWTFTSDVEGSTFECKVEPDFPTYSPCSDGYALPTYTDGAYTFTVRAINPDGVVDPSPALSTVVVDTQAPDTSATLLGSTPSTSPTTNFVLTSDETATFECNIDSAGYQPCDSAYTTPSLQNGEHSLLVRAIDAAGNLDSTPASINWSVDAPLLDSDNDGVIDAVESAGPNNGDANNDGIPDAEQPNVTSLRNLDGTAYVVLATNCDTNSGVTIGVESSQHKDVNFTYPGGVISFTATGCAPPSCVPCSNIDALGAYHILCCPASGNEPTVANITLLLYGQNNTDTVKVRKYNDTNHTYSSIDDAVIESQTVVGSSALKVSYTVADGGNLDADGAVNGTIVDPVGVAVPANTAASSNSTDLAKTGESIILITITAITLTGLSILVFKLRNRIR